MTGLITYITFGAITVLGIGFLVFMFNKLSQNPMAKTLFEKETLKALKTDEGYNIIKEQSYLASKDTFDRAFSQIKKLEEKTEKDLKCTNDDVRKISDTLISFIATITGDIKYLVKTVDEIKEIKNKKPSDQKAMELGLS